MTICLEIVKKNCVSFVLFLSEIRHNQNKNKNICQVLDNIKTNDKLSQFCLIFVQNLTNDKLIGRFVVTNFRQNQDKL